jgi:hypothetical protein
MTNHRAQPDVHMTNRLRDTCGAAVRGSLDFGRPDYQPRVLPCPFLVRLFSAGRGTSSGGGRRSPHPRQRQARPRTAAPLVPTP